MDKLDKYINSVCKNLNGNTEELSTMKQEIESHLLQTVEELKSQGKSEEESINEAIKRFGEANVLKNQLMEVYNSKNSSKNTSKKFIILAFVSLFIGVMALIPKYINNTYSPSNLLDPVGALFLTNKPISNEDLKTLFINNKNKYKLSNHELKYIAIHKYPIDYDGNTAPYGTSFDDAEYIYPTIREIDEQFKKSGYIANCFAAKDYFDTANKYRWHITIAYEAPRLSFVAWIENFIYYTPVRFLPYLLIALSFILFTIPILISIHHSKKVSYV